MSEEQPTHTQCIDCGKIWDPAAHWLIDGFVRDADGDVLCRPCWSWRKVERRLCELRLDRARRLEKRAWAHYEEIRDAEAAKERGEKE